MDYKLNGDVSGAGRSDRVLPRRRNGSQSATLLVELLGPAGAGKTTLCRQLTESIPAINLSPPLALRKPRQIPTFARYTFPLIPLFVRAAHNGRAFTWEEVKAAAYVKGWSRVLKAERAPDVAAVLLDHGPVFRLTFLNEFGPPILKSPDLEPWWRSIVEPWAQTLDMLFWLDAPDHVLVERINRRAQKHEIKGGAKEAAREFLDRYRRSFEEIVERFVARGGVHPIRLDSSRYSPQQLMQRFLAEMNSGATGGDPPLAR